MTNHTAGAVGRKAWIFAGAHRARQRTVAKYLLFMTVRLNDVDPRAPLADVIAGIADHPARRLDKLRPWAWRVEKKRGIANCVILVGFTRRWTRDQLWDSE